MGRRAVDLPRPDDASASPTSSPSPVRAARRCWPTWPSSIEQHVEWVTDCLADLRARRASRRSSRRRWPRRAGTSTSPTAPPSPCYPTADSWYMGANVPGKPRVFLPYVGGVDTLPRRLRRGGGPGLPRVHPGRARWRRSATTGWSAACSTTWRCCSRPWTPSGSPRWRRCPSTDARASHGGHGLPCGPPGPTVGEVVDGTLPGAAGRSRLPAATARPAGPPSGRLPTSTGAAGCSADRTPTTRSAATCASGPTPSSCRWTTGTRPRRGSRRRPTTPSPPCSGSPPMPTELGGIPGQLAVAGWSAGRQPRRRRLPAGPGRRRAGHRRPAAGDARHRRRPCAPPSYVENAEGYVLTAPLMRWFWDHYADPHGAERPQGVAAARALWRTCRPPWS